MKAYESSYSTNWIVQHSTELISRSPNLKKGHQKTHTHINNRFLKKLCSHFYAYTWIDGSSTIIWYVSLCKLLNNHFIINRTKFKKVKWAKILSKKRPNQYKIKIWWIKGKTIKWE